MLSPSNPEQKGSEEVLHDSMNNAGHEAQANKDVNDKTINQEDSEENTLK